MTAESAAPGPRSGNVAVKTPPGATYDTGPTAFRLSVRSPAPQGWLVAPLAVLWLGIAYYAFVIGPRRPDDPASSTLVLSAFAALIGIPLLASVLFSRFGRVTVSYEHGEGSVRTHIGRVGQTRRFAWEALASAREVEMRGRFMRARGIELNLSAARAHRRLYFGKGLPDEARRYAIAVLESEIAKGRHGRPLGLAE